MMSAKRVKPEKKPYITPKLTVHGDIRQITRFTSCPGQLDQTFPAGTDYGDVTCSQ